MAKRKYWYAMFSQTGSEIAAICQKLDIKPDLVLTNNKNHGTWHPFIHTCTTVVDTHDILMESLDVPLSNTFITMHGYLRIIPAHIANRWEMYNGHPGLITKYPELKGKDPQEMVAKNLSLYEHIGSVVHRVTPEVDSGEVLTSFAVFNSCNSKEEVYDTLKLTSLHSWLQFFKERNECELA